MWTPVPGSQPRHGRIRRPLGRRINTPLRNAAACGGSGSDYAHPTNGTRTAIYARVSTTDQNCEMQLRELREYVSRRGWEVAGEYVDTGFSGAKASRPALNSLMADAAGRRFDTVVVWKIDRFGRSVLNLNQQLAALTNYGVRFIATSQSLDTDQANPTSRLLLQILASVAEFEREMIRERTLTGIRAARAKGKRIGRPKRIFRRDEVVQLRDQEGLSWRAIAAALGVPVTTALSAYRSYQAAAYER